MGQVLLADDLPSLRLSLGVVGGGLLQEDLLGRGDGHGDAPHNVLHQGERKKRGDYLFCIDLIFLLKKYI